MTSKDANKVVRRRVWLWWGIGLATVAGLAVGMNRMWGPAPADAQAPRPTTKATAGSGAVRPAAATSSPASAEAAAPRSGTATAPAAKGGATPPRNAAGPAQAGATAPGKANGKAAGGTPQAADNELKVVAIVNGEQITRQDLARECLARYGKEVLEAQVNRHLIFQACLQKGVKITEKDVTDEIERIAKKFGLSVDRWMTLLEQERNVGPVEYRSEIIWPALALRALASDQMTVTPDEMKKAFESEFGAKVRVRVISVSSRKTAEELLAKAKADPNSFPNLAKDFSEDPSASVMGMVPPIRMHSGVEQLEKVAFKLKVGEISPIVPVANQHMILKCEEHMDAVYLAGEQLKTAQNQLRERIRDQKMRTASADLFKKLQNQAQVVNVLNDPEKQKQHPGVAALINGKPITMRELSEACIARHGNTVLDGEINRKILQQELKRLAKTVDDNDIQAEVTRAADSYGYVKKDGTPDVDAWLKAVTENDHTTIDLYVRDAVWPSAALKKLIGGNASVTEEDMKKGFEANYGERVEIMAIVLGNQRQAQQVWEMARDHASDSFFGELAQQYSIEPASRANSGRVPPLRKHSGQPLLEEAAFKLKPGELSPIISVGDKFVIIRCLGRTKPVVAEMTDEVRTELTKDLVEKKLRASMGKEFDRLKDEAQVDNFLAGSSQPGKRSRSLAAPGLSTNGDPGGRPTRSATAPVAAPRAGAVKR